MSYRALYILRNMEEICDKRGETTMTTKTHTATLWAVWARDYEGTVEQVAEYARREDADRHARQLIASPHIFRSRCDRNRSPPPGRIATAGRSHHACDHQTSSTCRSPPPICTHPPSRTRTIGRTLGGGSILRNGPNAETAQPVKAIRPPGIRAAPPRNASTSHSTPTGKRTLVTEDEWWTFHLTREDAAV